LVTFSVLNTVRKFRDFAYKQVNTDPNEDPLVQAC